MIGTTISHYKVLEKLGEGGMGVVYKAEDTKLKRTVALKFLPQHVSASETDKARFLLEAQAAAALNHPNICTIYGIEEHEGRTFIAMEFVDGQTLREKNGTLNLNKAIDIGIQIAEGLAVAHEKGIVHRDIKPENIMVRKDGIVQIMDFGLAKLRASRTSKLTKEGSTVGTAGYMAPEQVQGQETDHRSDIFSLGVVLHELFTGELPFRGVHETALLYEIVNVDPAPMSALKPEIDPELDRIVLECLQKEPDERYNSVKDIAKDLKRFKRESSRSRVSRVSRPAFVSSKEGQEETKAAQTFRKERIIWISALVVIVAIFLVKFIGTTEVIKPAGLNVRFSISSPEKTITGETTVSPNGKIIAFTATGEGVTLLWVRPLGELNPQPLFGTENAEFPFWSQDSRYIGFFADGKLKKIDVTGGSSIAICEESGGFGGAWNAAGDILFSSDKGGLFRVASGGGVPKQVTFLDTLAKESSHRWPSFLPDGNRFLFVALRVTDELATTYLSSMTDTSRIPILKSDANAIFAPPSNVLFLNNRTLMSERFDLGKGTLTGEPHPIATNVGYVPRWALGDFSYSTSGILTTGGGRSVNREYAWFDRSGKQLGTACPPGNYFDIAVSPSGQHAAIQRVDVQTNNSDIWTIDLTRSLLSRFTFDPAVDDYPVWSADGGYIYFASAKGGTYNIQRKAASGIGSPEDVTSNGFSQMPMDISGDGKYLLYLVLNPKTGEDLWVRRLDSTKQSHPFIANEFMENYGRFSPDEKWVAYTSNESGKNEVYVQSFSASGGRWQVSVNGGSQPRWRQDGGELFYIAPDLRLMTVEIRAGVTFDFSMAKPLFLTRIDSYDSPNRFVVVENGQKFLINIPVGDEFANPITVTINPDL